MNPGPYRRSRLVIFEPRNQPLGLLDTALRYAQLGQRGQCLAVLHRKCVVRQFDRRVQLGFGLTPVTHGDEHSAVEGAALREQERATVATREGVRGADPLHRPLEVGTQSAGHNHVAAGPHDRVGGRALSAERTRHRLVEPGHAFGKPALSDEQGPTWLAAQNSRSRSPAVRANSCACRAQASPATGSSLSEALMTSSQPRMQSNSKSSTSRARRATQPAEAAVLPICWR